MATIINHPDFLLYSEKLTQDSFFDTTNGCLFVAISELYNNKIENIDTYNLITAINNNLKLKKQLGDDFSVDTISDIISFSVHIARHTSSEYTKLVDTVVNFAFKRRLHKDLEKCQIDCFKDEISIADLHKSVQDKIDEATVNFVTSDVKPYKDIVGELWNQTQDRFNIAIDSGYASKFVSAREYFTYEPGELVLVSAKRKRGKSMFALNEAVHKLESGIGVLYVDTELQDRLFNERLLSYLSGVEFKKLRKGDFSESQKADIEKAIKFIKKSNFFHVHMPRWDKDKLYLLAKKLMRNYKTTFFVFDHLKTTDSKDASTAYHELGSKVNFIKDVICGELGYAGLTLAQLNRAGDIGDSYKLEQEVSTVATLEKKTEDEITKDTPDCGNYKLFIKANRNGNEMDDIDSEYIDLMFRGNLCKFEEVTQHNAPPDPF